MGDPTKIGNKIVRVVIATLALMVLASSSLRAQPCAHAPIPVAASLVSQMTTGHSMPACPACPVCPDGAACSASTALTAAVEVSRSDAGVALDLEVPRTASWYPASWSQQLDPPPPRF